MSFDPKDDNYVFQTYSHVYNHTNGDVPLSVLHNLHILNQLKIVSMLQSGYANTDASIMLRCVFSVELKIRKLIKELKDSKNQV